MSPRHLTGQQDVGDADPLLHCAGCLMEEELRAERESAARSAGAPLRRAQQFAEAGLEIATDITGMLGPSHWRKGSLIAVGMRARGSQWRKCLTVVVFRIGLIAERWARTCFIRHPRSDIKLS
jgi:hypothetical protein